MRRDEMHALRDMRRHVLEHRALDRADVGNDCARLQRCRDLLRNRPARADRNTDDDEVSRASASFAFFPFVSEKWIRMKLPTLGVTFRPSLPISSVSHASHFSLCWRERSTCATSLIAATPAAIAAAFTLNGPRMRLSAPITCAGA